MENILKKAVTGGWNGKPAFNGIAVNTKNIQAQLFLHGNFVKVWFCDPLFWQALSKACGWGIQIGDYKGDVHVNHQHNNGKCTEMCVVPSVKNALYFHEINLTEGFEKAVEYLENLINE